MFLAYVVITAPSLFKVMLLRGCRCSFSLDVPLLVGVGGDLCGCASHVYMCGPAAENCRQDLSQVDGPAAFPSSAVAASVSSQAVERDIMIIFRKLLKKQYVLPIVKHCFVGHELDGQSIPTGI